MRIEPANPDNFRVEHALPCLVYSLFDSQGLQTAVSGSATEDSRFPLASVTKTFTAHLCLAEPFRRQLDRPFREVLPWFRLQDEAAARAMTPRDALCHFSGLPPHTDDWVRCELSRERYIRERLPLLNSAGPFREKHRYSNLMYAVLGLWLEKIGGSRWEERVTGDLLNPLGLHRTGHLDESWTEQAPPPHALDAGGRLREIPPFFAKRNHLIAPASELIGSMPDLAAWGRHLLSLPITDERWKPHSFITETRPFPEFGPLSYGLGWRLDTVCGEKRVWHSGQCSGYTTLLSLYPERQTGLAAATNRTEAVNALHQLDLRINF